MAGRIVPIATALMAVALLSCVRYARLHRISGRSGTCDGACRHYVSCKDDDSPAAFQGCMADCREIYEFEGEQDRESLTEFEDLECKDAVAFVDGTRDGRGRTVTSHSLKGRSQSE